MAVAREFLGFINRIRSSRPQRKGGGGQSGNTTAAVCDERQRESFGSSSGPNSGACSTTGSRHGPKPNLSQSPSATHQLGAVAGSGATVPSAGAGATTPSRGTPPVQSQTTSSVRLPPPTKSPRDYNEYRVIRLDNGLTALLISGAELSAETPTYMPSPTVPSASALRAQRLLPRIENTVVYDDEEEDDEDEDENIGQEGPPGFKPTIQFDGNEQQASNHSGVMIIESVAACGLCVGVGSFSDPPEFQGLAHLLEHMVFMGSERFPRENEFDAFLNKHGGETNASTDSEATTFYFDCQYQYLFRALERFAQFFISPLIKRGALSRELEALDSEFQSVLQSDSCRRQQLFSQCARPHHPATQFLWGNIQSLRADPDDRLYRLVHEFRRRHYSAHRMTLAVKAPIRLDMLEARVVQFFSQVPSNNLPPLDFSRLPPPFDTPHFRRLYCILPVKDTCQVDLTWALPSCLHMYRSKPHDLAAWMLGHEGRGSLISYLRRKLWALDVCTGNWDGGYEMNSLYSLFSIHLTLTDEGAAST